MFDADVKHILQAAQQRSPKENLDFFLAVIDLINERVVEAELDDEALFEFEGLFELGDEDAYSPRLFDPDRLHDHVERTQNECWRLQVARSGVFGHISHLVIYIAKQSDDKLFCSHGYDSFDLGTSKLSLCRDFFNEHHSLLDRP